LQTTEIYEPVVERLAKVEDRLKSLVRVKFPLLSELLGHVYESLGKRVRPAITLLASNFHEHDGTKVEIMASAVELLHVATLIHDDTVDASDFRRGKATISNLWGRNIAVLVGDYIFASSATFVCDTENISVIKRFSQTIMELSSGELRELADSFNPDQTLESYYQRIYDKTASLFTTAGESGAVLSGAPVQHSEALKEYSRELGMAFQIIDDILDFEGTPEEVGKPIGSDLAHGILTLPALIAIEQYPTDNPIRRFFADREDTDLLAKAVDMVQQRSIIDEAFAIAEQRCSVSREALLSLPKNPSRDSLDELLNYVITRRS
jgi:all-trans-nonaprenyl-diphosphate synthase